MSLDLKQDVFESVVARLRTLGDSLRRMMRFPNSGIEGWFKVEIVAALGDKVTSVNNVGPDLTLEGGTRIEIKAATTNFGKSWCVTTPLRKYGEPVLFLAGGANPAKLTRGEDDPFEIVGLEVVSDGANDWLLGMVKPRA